MLICYVVFMVWAPEPRAELTGQSNYQLDKAAYYMLRGDKIPLAV